jgi:hypothetical protein
MTITEPHPEHPIAVEPPLIALALLELAECVCAELAATGAGPTCWCGVYPGAAVSWEYCSAGECSNGVCGMGYVRLAGAFPYETFPVPALDDRCIKPLAWAVEVGALRCFPQPTDGHLNEPSVTAEISLGVAMDAAALWRAIKCCGFDAGVEMYRPAGPDGGCVGGFWTAFLSTD